MSSSILDNSPGSNVLFCAMPKSSKAVRVYEAAIAHYHPSIDAKKFGKTVRATIESSLLTHGFNRMWAAALTMRKTQGVTHFAMIHDDVGTGIGWCDVLLDEMESVGADMISAVVPIKDARGLTSTGIDNPENPFAPRRLTMHEVMKEDETFTKPEIILNTGLFLVDLRKDWCDKVCFRQTDRLAVTSDGQFVAQTAPEDWDFSRQVRALGGSLWATRKVKLFHERPEFCNSKAWGTMEVDTGDVKRMPEAGPPKTATEELSRVSGLG